MSDYSSVCVCVLFFFAFWSRVWQGIFVRTCTYCPGYVWTLMCVAWERGGWMEARKAVETGRDHRRPSLLASFLLPCVVMAHRYRWIRALANRGVVCWDMAWHGMAWVAVLSADWDRGEGRWDWHVPFSCPSDPIWAVIHGCGYTIQTAMRLLSAGGCLGLGIQGRGVKRV